MNAFFEILMGATRLPAYYYLLVATPAFAVYFFSKKRIKSSSLMSVFYSVLSFLFFAFICTFFFTKSEALQLTVYVHGPDGRQQIILSRTGKLIVDFGNDRRVAEIGENGRTNFGEIPAKFINQRLNIGLDAPGFQLDHPVVAGTFTGEPIYIAVLHDNSLGTITGIIKNKNGKELIKDALVIIGNDTVTRTDELGRFKIILPINMQVKDEKSPYLLTIKKLGYEIETEYCYPKSGSVEIRLIPAP